MSVATLEKSLIAKVRPLEDRVLLKRAIEEEKSKGGIIFPDTAKEKPIKGIVMKAGPGKRLESGETLPMSVKAGDEVLFGKYAGTEVKLEDEEYIVMRESDIIAIIER